MSAKDKLKALGEKAKAAFHNVKAEAHLAKDDVETTLDRSTTTEGPFERAGEKIDETLNRDKAA
jgi:hypothetical protein